MKIFAWIALGVVLAVILFLVFYLAVGAILFKIIFSRRNVTARALSKNVEQRLNEFKINLGWWEKMHPEKVSIQSYDGLKLVGHLLKANSNAVAIVFHGFGQTYSEMQPWSQFFYEKNFNVLTVDMRAHGQSEGKCVGYGLFESQDVKSWTDFVHEKFPQSKILLFGLSMGATAVCMASGLSDLQVDAIVSDCAFDDANREISYVMKKKKANLPLLKKLAFDYVKRMYGLEIMQADAKKRVKKSSTPILFIHGQDDNFVPVQNMQNLFNAAPPTLRDKFVVEGADHAKSYVVAGVLYQQKITAFIKRRTSIKLD